MGSNPILSIYLFIYLFIFINFLFLFYFIIYIYIYILLKNYLPKFISSKNNLYYQYMPVYCSKYKILYLINNLYWNYNEFPTKFFTIKNIIVKSDINYIFFVNNYREFMFDIDCSYYNNTFDLGYLNLLEENSLIPKLKNDFFSKTLLCYNSSYLNNNFFSYSEYYLSEINLSIHIGAIPFILYK